VHASDADQAEALLTRWGPDGLGKLGGELSFSPECISLFLPFQLPVLDPRWAIPIKARVRETNQARAINEVVNALKPVQSYPANTEDAPLRVVNGISTQSSSMITVAARENVRLSTTDGLPGRPGNSTIRWGGGLVAHPEQELEDEPAPKLFENNRLLPEPKRVVTPSLATLERAVSARIYFENLYFPLLRQPPSREQRRLAMERDMLSMGLSEPRKEDLRTRWRKNETDYLREQRRKVDVSAFVKLKTIGHGEYASESFDCLAALKLPPARCIWRCVSGERTKHWQVVCYEAGACLLH
jgi:protein-serine/threonine kinase